MMVKVEEVIILLSILALSGFANHGSAEQVNGNGSAETCTTCLNETRDQNYQQNFGIMQVL